MALQETLEQTRNQVGENLHLEFAEWLRARPKKLDEAGLPLGLTAKVLAVKDAPAPWTVAAMALAELRRSRVHPCFLHGLTSEGWLNLAPYFIGDCDQIHLEGKETLDALNWLLHEVENLGQVVDIVLHPLDPDEIIGMVFPKRRLAVWQGNPKRLSDQGLKEVLGTELKKALETRADVQAQLKGIYTETVDFVQVDALREQLLNEILKELEARELD